MDLSSPSRRIAAALVIIALGVCTSISTATAKPADPPERTGPIARASCVGPAIWLAPGCARVAAGVVIKVAPKVARSFGKAGSKGKAKARGAFKKGVETAKKAKKLSPAAAGRLLRKLPLTSVGCLRKVAESAMRGGRSFGLVIACVEGYLKAKTGWNPWKDE